MAAVDGYGGLRMKTATRLNSKGLSVIVDHSELHRLPIV